MFLTLFSSSVFYFKQYLHFSENLIFSLLYINDPIEWIYQTLYFLAKISKCILGYFKFSTFINNVASNLVLLFSGAHRNTLLLRLWPRAPSLSVQPRRALHSSPERLYKCVALQQGMRIPIPPPTSNTWCHFLQY